MKKTKNKRRIVRWTAVVVCILLISLLCWQWESAKIVFWGLFYSDEQRSQLVQEKEESVKAILDEIPEVDVEPLPPNTEKLIVEGFISEEEAMDIVTKQSTLEELMEEKGVAFGEDYRGRTIIVVKDETGAYVPYKKPAQDEALPQDNPPKEATEKEEASSSPSEVAGPKKPTQKDTPVKQSSQLQTLIAKLYVLRSTYIGKLDALVAQAKKEYYADKSRKSELEGKYLRLGSSMEKECDAQMETLISQIHAELIRTGGDLGLIDEIRAVYAQEKSAKKAALFAQYAK